MARAGPGGKMGGQVGQGPEMLQEHWLLHFCEKEEKKQLLLWMHQEGLSRPKAFDDRLAHAESLRHKSNEWYKKDDFRRALHCIMGAVHTLDYCPAEQMGQSEPERQQVAKAMLPIMSNAAMIFLKRGDAANAVVAATAGLKCADKVSGEDAEVRQMRSKLRWRRGVARGEAGPARDLDAARADLTEAARLDPGSRDIRECLENCRKLLQQERKNDPLRYKPPAPAQPEPEQDDAADISAAGAPAAEGDGGPSELPPAAEKFAECVGRCLGRARRRWRWIRASLRGGCPPRRPAAAAGAAAALAVAAAAVGLGAVAARRAGA